MCFLLMLHAGNRSVQQGPFCLDCEARVLKAVRSTMLAVAFDVLPIQNYAQDSFILRI